MNIDNIKSDKSAIAVVVVCYNRPASAKRLLDSLNVATYPNANIPLIISVDCSENEEMYDLARNFEWKHGPKYPVIHTERLGLKKHIYECGDLSEYFKAIILLEDDLFVSPFFYSYVHKTLDKYGDDSRIAQISLYKNESNGYVGLPMSYMQNGSDVFLMQDVSTWGECWTESMWNQFKKWRDSHSDEDIQNIDLPDRIKKWTRAWSKYYNAYVVDTGKYVLYPNMPVTTNFSDAGEHGGDNNSIVQVNLLQGDLEYRLKDYGQLVKYDIYFNNEVLYEWLGLSREDLCLDVYGFHNNVKGCRYILSTRVLPYKIVRSFALNMRPIELNVKYKIHGNGLCLYDTSVSAETKTSGYYSTVVPYFLKGFDMRLLIKYNISWIKQVMKRKLKMR